MKSKNDVLIGCLCAFGCESLFGFSFLFSKNATNVASPLALLGWRFLVAFIVISICAATGIMQVHLKGKSLKPLLIIGLVIPVLYFIGETYGIAFTTASESGVVISTIPVVSVMASSIFLKEKPLRQQIIGIFVSLVGVIITVLAVGRSVSFSIPGYIMLFIAVFSYAIYSVLVEKAINYTGAEVTFGMLGVGAVVFLILACGEALANGTMSTLVTLPFKNVSFLSAVLYQGIGCSVMGFFMSNIALAKIGVNRTASFVGLSSAVSIISGTLFLHEPFTLYQLIGAGLIVGGVYIANSRLSH
ncbi:MAG: DMT family transporter [Lachnospiraceae bacterium]|nr:DMT family transporter [Candidatus Equihabitans merdae]